MAHFLPAALFILAAAAVDRMWRRGAASGRSATVIALHIARFTIAIRTRVVVDATWSSRRWAIVSVAMCVARRATASARAGPVIVGRTALAVAVAIVAPIVGIARWLVARRTVAAQVLARLVATLRQVVVTSPLVATARATSVASPVAVTVSIPVAAAVTLVPMRVPTSRRPAAPPTAALSLLVSLRPTFVQATASLLIARRTARRPLVATATARPLVLITTHHTLAVVAIRSRPVRFVSRRASRAIRIITSPARPLNVLAPTILALLLCRLFAPSETGRQPFAFALLLPLPPAGFAATRRSPGTLPFLTLNTPFVRWRSNKKVSRCSSLQADVRSRQPHVL